MNEKNLLTKFELECFQEQLRKARVYRGYSYQANLCDHMGIIRQSYSLWEKGERYPDLSKLIELANYLQIDLGYFFLKRADPEDHDLTLDKKDRTREEIEKRIIEDKGDSILLMPFKDTFVSRTLYRALSECLYKRGTYTISVTPDSGITRALIEYEKSNSEVVKVIEGEHFNADELKYIEGSKMLIFDDAFRFSQEILKYIIFTFSTKYFGSIVLIGRNMQNIVKEFKLTDRIDDNFTVPSLSVEDFESIILAAFPEANENIITLIKSETSGWLKRLFNFVKKIDEKKQADNVFPITLDSIFNILNNIK